MKINKPSPHGALVMASYFAIGASFLLALAAWHGFTGSASALALAAFVVLALVTLAVDVACLYVLPEAQRAKGRRAWVLRVFFIALALGVGYIDKLGVAAVEAGIQSPVRDALELSRAEAAARLDAANVALEAFEGRLIAQREAAQGDVASPDLSARRAAREELRRLADAEPQERAPLSAAVAAAKIEDARAEANVVAGPPGLPAAVAWAIAAFLLMMKGPLLWAATPRPEEIERDPFEPPAIARAEFEAMPVARLEAWASAGASHAATARAVMRGREKSKAA